MPKRTVSRQRGRRRSKYASKTIGRKAAPTKFHTKKVRRATGRKLRKGKAYR